MAWTARGLRIFRRERAPGQVRPPPYPTNSTTAGRGPSMSRGVVSQAEIRSPAYPRKRTSHTVTVLYGVLTCSLRTSMSWRRDSVRVRYQKWSKSSGSTTDGR